MKPLRNGDLTDIPGAAELIDAAQEAAKKLAQCCAERDAEIERLRERVKLDDELNARLSRDNARMLAAIIELDECIDEAGGRLCGFERAMFRVREIAREGR